MDPHDEAATAHAFWIREPGFGELRGEALRTPGPDEVLVRARYSGVSRGTEALVFRGGVPVSQHAAMRAPFQDGEFPGPVKYGYLSVGRVERGPATLVDRTVFCLYPHQDRYVVPAAAVTVVPAAVPAGRAVLAGAVETAVNALWDAGPLVGDRIAVIGAGMVGCCVARLLSGLPAARVQLVDADPARERVAAALGVAFRTPETADDDRDLVLHVSANPAGLTRALQLVGDEGTVVELSWYGDRTVALPLGEAFHARRLTIRSSQVGAVSPARRARRSHADRMAVALELLADPAFDALVTGESAFAELPEIMPRLASGELPALCHRIVYPGG
jgi:NADPH:quinone reductase-like Zn-dependent oxidoreductase